MTDQNPRAGSADGTKKYPVEQIVSAVNQHEQRTPATAICRQLGIAEATFFRRRQQYGGLEQNEARKLQQLREENAKLKRIVADLSLDRAMLQNVTRKKW